MQRVTVLYPNKEGSQFDFDYYMKKHIPWVAGLVGRSIEVRRGLSSATGGPAPFTCLATIQVNTIDEFQAVFAKHGAEIWRIFRTTPTLNPSSSLTRSLNNRHP